MTRRRKAILIDSGNVAGAPQLLGASQDVKNWMTYLKTPLGGFWNDHTDEIKQMSMPSKDELINELMSLSCYDYAFITFSGHGGHNTQTGKDFIFLNNTTIIPINEIIDLLKPLEVKTTLIIDACRTNMIPPAYFKDSDNRKQVEILLENLKNPPITDYKDFPYADGILLESFCKPITDNIENIQKKWWKQMDSIPSEIVLIQSCNKGESASEGIDESQQFGLFSRSMIDAAFNKDFDNILSIKDAFDFASMQVAKNCKGDFIQTPKITVSSQYPFAVKLNKHKRFIDFYNEANYNDRPKTVYDGRKILLEFQTYKRIPGETKSYRIDKPSSFTNVQKHAHIFELPDGEGKEVCAVNIDGTKHDGSKYRMNPHEIEFFRKKGFNIPDNGLIECKTYISARTSNKLIILFG